MKVKDQSRFSIDVLRDLAGEAVFARGEAYHRGGQVQILTIEPKRVLAQVAGRAEEGLWVFEDGQPDERLVSFTVKLLSKAGRKADAEALLWRAFEKAPSLELYKQLRKLGGKTALERIIGILGTRSASNVRAGWYTPGDLLVSILVEERMFGAAWAAAREHKVSLGVKVAVADASKATYPREALEVYAEHVNQFVSTGGNHAYREAAKLIARMAILQSAAEQEAYVAALKVRHGQKRNFMKLLG